MRQLERRLQQRYPHWFRGRRAAVARPRPDSVHAVERALAAGACVIVLRLLSHGGDILAELPPRPPPAQDDAIPRAA